MKIFSKSFFTILSLLSNQLFSQNTFVRSYNSSIQQKGSAVFETGSNFLFVTDMNGQKANSFFIKLLMVDSLGYTKFSKSLHIPENGYLSGGIKFGDSFILAINYKEFYKNKSIILKIDSSLNEVWSITIANSTRELLATSLIQSSDNSILICGNCKSIYKDQRDFFILKLNPNGENLWYKEINIGMNTYISALQEKEDGTLILCGELEHPNHSRSLMICQTDSNGESPVFKSYNFNSNCGATFITKYHSNYVVGGYSNDANQKHSDGIVLFMDQNMDSTSSFTFDLGLNETIYSYTADANELTVVGNTQNYSSEYGDVFILKFDKNNSYINYKLIKGLSGNHAGSQITSTKDNGLIIGTTSYNCSALLIKTDRNGELFQLPDIESAHFELAGPNPSSGKFYFYGNDEVTKCIVYSMDGKIIKEFSSNEIDLTQYGNGIYFYEVKFSSGQIQTGKLIKLSY